MNNLSLTSKICLSLKSIDKVDFAFIAQKVTNLELRLDYIDISLINFELLASLFDIIILKIENLEQINVIHEKIKKRNILNKYIYDIDFTLFNNNELMLNKMLNKNNILISYHNLKYDKLLNILYTNVICNKLSNNKYIKLVVYDNELKYKKELLTKIYKYNNINKLKLIYFFEGEDYTHSRYQSILLGAPFLYCSINEEMKTGRGQPTLDEALRITKLLGSFCKNKQTDNQKNTIC